MYNAHRGMVPAPSNRLSELLDQVRAEFENQAGRSSDYEVQLQNQMQEMEVVRQKLHHLELTQVTIKQKYDEEVSRLHRELSEARGAGPQPAHLGAMPHNPGQAPPPTIGQGGGNLFGSVMTGGPGGSALAHPQDAPPPPAQPMQQQQQQQQQQQHAPPVLHQQMVQPPPQQHFPPYQPANGYTHPPPPSSSPRPEKGRPPRGHGPPTPQQGVTATYSDARASPQVAPGARPTPPPPQPQLMDVGNALSQLDPEHMPQDRKRVGHDWFVIFNPRVPRVLDVGLVHDLVHESVVCCVRFSQDGRYVATGCNRTAQIFDVANGQKVCHLEDTSVDKEGDLYIRSVCFSPDGRYLATGAEDKLIRVWDIQSRTIKQVFSGHEQDIYSLDFARSGHYIASGSGDRSVRLWDMEKGQAVLNLQIEDGVTTVAISPDARYVAAGSLDKSVRVWELESGDICERLEGPEGHKDSVYSVAFAPNGKDLVSGSLDRTIKMWELSGTRRMGGATRSGKCIRTFEGHRDFVLSVALTPDGRWVMSGSKDRGVQFWDPATGHAQLMLQGHKNSVISVAPSPTGEYFATGSGDQRARIWRYGDYHG